MATYNNLFDAQNATYSVIIYQQLLLTSAKTLEGRHRFETSLLRMAAAFLSRRSEPFDRSMCLLEVHIRQARSCSYGPHQTVGSHRSWSLGLFDQSDWHQQGCAPSGKLLGAVDQADSARPQG